MTPFRGTPAAGSLERVFNYRLSRARRVVENAFGIASSVFRVLRKPMLLEPEKAKKVVLTVMYLHNFLRRESASCRLYSPNTLFDKETENGEMIPGSWRSDVESSLQGIGQTPRRASQTYKNIRNHLAQHFATNGAIPWQNNY